MRGGDRFASGQDRAVSGVTATGPKVHKKGVIFQNFVMYAAFAFLDPSKRGETQYMMIVMNNTSAYCLRIVVLGAYVAHRG